MSGWKGQMKAYVDGSLLNKDERSLREATADNLRGKMKYTQASHTFIISKNERVVAGCYVQVTDHQCFVIAHTALYSRTSDYESYLVAHLYKHHCRNNDGAPRVFGVFRMRDKADDLDPEDDWLKSAMSMKLKGEYYQRIDSRRNSQERRGTELPSLHQETGIQQMWIGEFAILNFYVPVESGYERPTRQLNTAELENIEKGVSKVRHKEGALKHIANLEHLTLYNKRFIQRMKMVQQTLPYSKDVSKTPPSSRQKAKPKRGHKLGAIPKKRKYDEEEEEEDDDDDGDDGGDDDDDGGDDDGDDDGHIYNQSGPQEEMYDQNVSEDEQSVELTPQRLSLEAHHPQKKKNLEEMPQFDREELEDYLRYKEDKERKERERDQDDQSE